MSLFWWYILAIGSFSLLLGLSREGKVSYCSIYGILERLETPEFLSMVDAVNVGLNGSYD